MPSQLPRAAKREPTWLIQVGLLGRAQPRVVVAGFDRPNIRLVVRPVSGADEKHQLLPGIFSERRSLVYAATRRNAKAAADTLRVVCATNAFGMGIDRPDLEAVVLTSSGTPNVVQTL